MGGFDEEALDSVERYSLITNEWEEIARMPEPRFMHSSVLFSEWSYFSCLFQYIYLIHIIMPLLNPNIEPNLLRRHGRGVIEYANSVEK